MITKEPSKKVVLRPVTDIIWKQFGKKNTANKFFEYCIMDYKCQRKSPQRSEHLHLKIGSIQKLANLSSMYIINVHRRFTKMQSRNVSN